MHTSTVTVAVINNQGSASAKFNHSDLRVEWFSGTGGGGQHRNKHQNSCRLTHVPTGVTATAQTRSRKNSYESALSDLEQKVRDIARNSAYSKLAAIRKEQVGSGMRGDKIRTYRFQDDVVKDHVTGKTASARKVLEGNFDLLW